MFTDNRYSEKVRLTLPLELGRKIETMLRKREMTLNALISELVVLGLTCLDYPDLDPLDTLRGVDPSSDGGYGKA